ncbi:MAG: transcriptional regulator [Thermoproteota archaeon]|nr:transcriptional regulator [Candidatus Brockarchaeota archaeon]MBO3801527.1 transcriptional regulator [Candidatus Brockarchaeota archaeon]
MDKDQVIGVLMFLGSLVGILVYGALLFLLGVEVSLLTLQVSAFLAVAAFLGIMAWIGYTLATTPPPKPIEEIEKEIGSETKSIETESKTKTIEETKQEEKKES